MGLAEKVGITKKMWLAIGAVLVALVIVVAGFAIYQRVTTRTITAYFPSVNGVYQGDPVRVLGVDVGRVDSIEPRARDVRVVLRVDRGVDLPDDVRAVIVAQSLVSGRFVQLTPAYVEGAKLPTDADIPMDRTAIPMEWDDVKEQLTELSEAVGPQGADPGTLADAVEVAAENLDGNGARMNESIDELSTVMGTFADNRDDVFASVRALQQLTDALSQSHEQLMQFNGRMATVSEVLADTGDEISEGIASLNTAVGKLSAFLDAHSGPLVELVDQAAALTGILEQNDSAIRGLLHSAPNQLVNFYNIYNPLTGSLDGVFGLGMGNNLISLLCGNLAASARPMDSDAEVEKCVDLMVPIMTGIVVNYPPFISNPVIGKVARPDQITYQNADVKRRAQAGVRERDAISRAQAPDPLGQLLVPFGGEG